MPAETPQFSEEEIKEFEESRIQDKKQSEEMAEAEAPVRDLMREERRLKETLGFSEFWMEKSDGLKEEAESRAMEAKEKYEKAMENATNMVVNEPLEKAIETGTGTREVNAEEWERFRPYIEKSIEGRLFTEESDGEGGTKKVPKVEGFSYEFNDDNAEFTIRYDNPISERARE